MSLIMGTAGGRHEQKVVGDHSSLSMALVLALITSHVDHARPALGASASFPSLTPFSHCQVYISLVWT